MSSSAPRASVIIPAYHSADVIPGCLDALRAQSFRSFEVVIVNSSNEEDTERLVRGRYPEVVFAQSRTRLLPHAARNRGVALARGAFLVFTDPDCRARPDWLERLVTACIEAGGAAGGGIACGHSGWLERGIHLCKFPYQLPGLPPGPTHVVPTANACYSRELWNRIGPFQDDVFCGDSLLGRRATAAGVTPRFEPAALVHHADRPRLGRFLAERTRRGREFATVRSHLGDWTRARAAALALATPLRASLAILRVARSSARAGELDTLVATLPIQIAGQLLWAAGESRALLARAGGHPTAVVTGRAHRQEAATRAR